MTLTPQGRRVAYEAGTRIAAGIGDGQQVAVLYSPSTRTRETAEEMALGLADGLHRNSRSGVTIRLPQAEAAIGNFEFIIDGSRLPPTDAWDPSFPASAAHHPYLSGFWSAQEDRIGFWLTHPSECVESPETVAARLALFFRSLLDAPKPDISLLVTHSGPMRAYLRAAFGADPGEPEFCEWFRIDALGVEYRGARAGWISGNGSLHTR